MLSALPCASCAAETCGAGAAGLARLAAAGATIRAGRSVARSAAELASSGAAGAGVPAAGADGATISGERRLGSRAAAGADGGISSKERGPRALQLRQGWTRCQMLTLQRLLRSTNRQLLPIPLPSMRSGST